MITLDIYADPVCPWCLIGKAWLDQALAARPGHGLAITWWPFQLNPDLPAGGMDRRDYLEAKFGSQQAAVQTYLRVVQAAEAAGVQIDLARITRQPNTRDAQRLLYWAALEGRQGAVMDALMAGYFTQGLDIGEHDVLAGLAQAAGMDGAAVARLLASDADAELIVAREAEARRRGVTAVPTFVVAGRHVVSGAQPAALWLSVIDELAAAPAGTPLQ